jgi:hypothetical protein
VAIAAINPFVPYVVLVAELDRLLPRDIGLSNIGRTIDCSHHPKQAGHHEKSAEDRDSGNGVGAVMKDLGHGISFLLRTDS